MAKKRESPYIWATWLTRLLVGEHCCEWGVWFKAHHHSASFEKVPDTFDRAGWQVAHTNRLREVRAQLEAGGAAVFVESQNSFTLRGAVAALGGKPDIIAVNNGQGTIIDIKTGKSSPAHTAQVVLYMYAVPRVLQQYKGMKLDGRVVYNDREVEIPASAVNEVFVQNLGTLIKRLAAPSPPPRIANQVECGFCDITARDCPERAADSLTPEAFTGDF